MSEKTDEPLASSEFRELVEELTPTGRKKRASKKRAVKKKAPAASGVRKKKSAPKYVSLEDYNDRTDSLLRTAESVARDCTELRSQMTSAHMNNGEEMQALRRELRRTQYVLGGLLFAGLFYGLGVF